MLIVVPGQFGTEEQRASGQLQGQHHLLKAHTQEDIEQRLATQRQNIHYKRERQLEQALQAKPRSQGENGRTSA